MFNFYNITKKKKKRGKSVTWVFFRIFTSSTLPGWAFAFLACHRKCFTFGLSTMCKWSKSGYAFRFPDVHMHRQQTRHPSSPPPQRWANRLVGSSQIKNSCFFSFFSPLLFRAKKWLTLLVWICWRRFWVEASCSHSFKGMQSLCVRAELQARPSLFPSTQLSPFLFLFFSSSLVSIPLRFVGRELSFVFWQRKKSACKNETPEGLLIITRAGKIIHFLTPAFLLFCGSLPWFRPTKHLMEYMTKK